MVHFCKLDKMHDVQTEKYIKTRGRINKMYPKKEAEEHQKQRQKSFKESERKEEIDSWKSFTKEKIKQTSQERETTEMSKDYHQSMEEKKLITEDSLFFAH